MTFPLLLPAMAFPNSGGMVEELQDMSGSSLMLSTGSGTGDLDLDLLPAACTAPLALLPGASSIRLALSGTVNTPSVFTLEAPPPPVPLFSRSSLMGGSILELLTFLLVAARFLESQTGGIT